MIEPEPAAGAPDEVVYLILGSLQFSDACLRTYGHPDLLRVAAAVNGDDFVPYTDAIFLKAPGLGASVAWHQDGITHWESPDWDQGSHGFNFMAQLYGSTPANGVWVVPGTHKTGRVDIVAKVAEAGTERLPDAVPMVSDPGDVVISNRQLLHGSFANTSENWRVTINMGFHRRASVLGVQGGGILGLDTIYDDAHVRERSRTIGYAIDARRQRFPRRPRTSTGPSKRAGCPTSGTTRRAPHSSTTTSWTSASRRRGGDDRRSSGRERSHIRLTQQCRPEDMERVEQAYKSLGFKAELKSFFDDLPARLAKAHLVISRSGASSVAEMLVLGKPSILIPLPSSLEGDQLANAKVAEAAGAAWLMQEADLTVEALSDQIRLCLEKPDRLAEAAMKAKALGRPDAAEALADALERMIPGFKKGPKKVDDGQRPGLEVAA